MTRFLLPIIILVLAGCAHVVGYAGAHPGYIKCSGKGSIVGTGQTSAGAGITGGGQNSFTVLVDCGDGVSFEQGPLPVAPVVKP